MKNLYVVAHAQSWHHVEGLVGGWYDTGLTDLGREQAARIAQRIRDLIPEGAHAELYASDLMRAHQTAEAVAARLDIPIQTDPDLRERSCGEAEGKPHAWLAERFVFPPRTGNRMDHQEGIHGFETRRGFAIRVYRAMDRILASPCPHQIVVTHGGVLTFVVAAWIAMPLDACGHMFVRSTPGGISHLSQDDDYYDRNLDRLNDTSHLD